MNTKFQSELLSLRFTTIEELKQSEINIKNLTNVGNMLRTTGNSLCNNMERLVALLPTKSDLEMGDIKATKIRELLMINTKKHALIITSEEVNNSMLKDECLISIDAYIALDIIDKKLSELNIE